MKKLFLQRLVTMWTMWEPQAKSDMTNTIVVTVNKHQAESAMIVSGDQVNVTNTTQLRQASTL